MAFYEGLIAMEQGGLWGYVDDEGNKVIDFIYDEAAAFLRGVALVMKDGMFDLIDHDGDSLLNIGYPDMHRDPDEGVIIFHDGSAFGLMAEDGTIIVEPTIYSTMGEFEEGLLAVQPTDGGLWGYMDTAGDIVIPASFDGAFPFSSERGLVADEGYFGFINHAGEFVIPATFDDAWMFDDHDRAIVENSDDSYSLINTSGTVIIDSVTNIWGEGPIYEVEVTNLDYRLYKADGTPFTEVSYTYTNTYGDYVFNLEWEVSEDSFDEIILFNPDGSIDYSVDYYTGDYVFGPYEKPYIWEETDDGILLHTYDYEATIDASYIQMVTDTLIIADDYTHTGAFSLTATPTIIIPLMYYNLMPLADDFAIAENDDGIGIINLANETIVPFNYGDFNIMPNLGFYFS